MINISINTLSRFVNSYIYGSDAIEELYIPGRWCKTEGVDNLIHEPGHETQ